MTAKILQRQCASCFSIRDAEYKYCEECGEEMPNEVFKVAENQQKDTQTFENLLEELDEITGKQIPTPNKSMPRSLVLFVTGVTAYNFFSGITSVIWLTAIGNVNLVIGAIITSIISTFLLPLPLMLPLIFEIPALKFYENNKDKIGLLFSILGGLTVTIIMTCWAVFIFNYLIVDINNANTIPLYMLILGTTLSPFIYFLSKENSQNSTSAITTFIYEIGLIFFILGHYFGMTETIRITFLFLIIFISNIGFSALRYKLIKQQI